MVRRVLGLGCNVMCKDELIDELCVCLLSVLVPRWVKGKIFGGPCDTLYLTNT